MALETATKNVISRFNELGYGCTFTFDELQKWLGVKLSENGSFHKFLQFKENQKELTNGHIYVGRIFDQLNDHLIIEHSVCLIVDTVIQGFRVAFPSKLNGKVALIHLSESMKQNERGD